MKIKLTGDQINEILNDSYLDITSDCGFGIYLEVGTDPSATGKPPIDDHAMLGFKYGEISQNRRHAYVFNREDLELLKPKRPADPSWYHNDPLCPNCQTYMIYKFEHCPRCGQKLDWSERHET